MKITEKRIRKILDEVKLCAAPIKNLSDEKLQQMTQELKAELASGKTTEQILPRAYAVIGEADRRVLGMYPYDVQIMGAIALHYGYLAEMNTGEGKTLTATLPLYLNALTGKSTILVTANEYLAWRDAAYNGPIGLDRYSENYREHGRIAVEERSICHGTKDELQPRF
ncbi:MAG: hypothetical protein LKE86_07200 [Eubacterium sp.]|jgi:preprotein translocase subunit SecA|nr:hypothetical protein [Eubacterium sp.]MCH4047198.1 hypothetical protein [Eubacterium sp.]MCH4080295.1 hypothetical protein [Eubacterium sp.]MCH4110854.1 hypothetical protein [Eubacterium sp.]